MRLPSVAPVLLAAALLGVASCGTTGGTEEGGPSGSGSPVRAGDAMSADLFPLAPSRARFVLASGETRTVSVEPEGGGAVLWIEGPAGRRRIDVTIRDGSYLFSAGPDATTGLIHVGATPGTAWRSGDADVRFEGWERVTVAAGTYDVARVTTATGPETLRVVQTWWFAPGTGLVRLRSDRGGIFTEEMSLAPAE